MSAATFTSADAEQANIVLITDEKKGLQAVHDAVVAMQANRRSGTAKTKTKGEVAGSGAKPWRQKGTGRARAGYKSSPIWNGGGTAHGPKIRDYSKHVPKAVKRLAFRKAFSERIKDGDVLIVESFAVTELKTKGFVALVNEAFTGAKKTLVIGASFDETTYKSARNVKTTQLTVASDVNTEQLLSYDKIIVTRDGIQKLSERLAA
jgi:large subunit ribosomal protein L4